MLQQARPGGRLADAAAGGALRGPFLAPLELQVSLLCISRDYAMTCGYAESWQCKT